MLDLHEMVAASTFEEQADNEAKTRMHFEYCERAWTRKAYGEDGRKSQLDYIFTTAEDVGEDTCPLLARYDNDLHGVWALAVDANGVTQSLVQWAKGEN